jgi:hypothetical protein
MSHSQSSWASAKRESVVGSKYDITGGILWPCLPTTMARILLCLDSL